MVVNQENKARALMSFPVVYQKLQFALKKLATEDNL